MSTFIFSNEDSDDEAEPMPNIVNRVIPEYDISDQKPIEVKNNEVVNTSEQSSNVFSVKSRAKTRTRESKEPAEFVEREEDFPDLVAKDSGRKSTDLGMWEKQGLPHEYAETNVIATIKMPPIFAKRRKPKTELLTEDQMEEFLEEESDGEFVEEEEDEEINPNLGETFSKGGW